MSRATKPRNRTMRHNYGAKTSSFSYDQRPGESLEHYATRLAKQADQRMVRLEKLTGQKHFASANKYAYARAAHDIGSWGGTAEGKLPRWNRAMPTNAQSLKAKIADMKNFLMSPTSTKKGIVDVYKKRADTLNKKLGTNFTWEDLANYFESGIADKADRSYGGSSTALIAFYNLKVSDEEQADRISKANDQHKVTSTPVDDITEKLKKEGWTYSDGVFKKIKKRKKT